MQENIKPAASDPDIAEQFAAHCAHDLNNLLTGILGNLELMQNRARRSGVKDFDGYLEGARNAAGRAADFARRLLIFSGRATQDPEAVPVDRLAKDLAELMRERGHPVSVAAANGRAVFCDPAQLEVALLELLNNAVQAAAGQSGTVSVKTGTADGQVFIAIQDTGTGMTPETVLRATEPFFSTRRSGTGKGLGLSIAAHFARRAGGSMEIDSQPGKGTTVTLRLPEAKDG